MKVAASTAVALLLVVGTTGKSCLDNDGKEVKWSFTYKMPNGYKNAYIDANSPSGGKSGLSLFERDMDDTENPTALIKTLLALEDDSWITERFNTTRRTDSSSNSAYLLYNDEPDKGPKSGTLGEARTLSSV